VNRLLDTQVALWAITDSPRLSTRARALIEDPNATIWVSAASLWEISIKHGLGRGEMPVSGPDALAFFQQAGLRILSIAAEHVVAVAALPPDHQDPFDRILIAQAQVEPMHLITHDTWVAKYDPAIILV
jgi:PIN domain nuclease of toxin-antitoxin system